MGNILLVDDDAMDVKAVRRALSRRGVDTSLTVARDGQEALDLLRGEDGRPRMARPLLILLDLQMPRMNGFEFLHALRGDPTLRHTPVYVLTTSAHDVDRRKVAVLGVEGYILKGDADAFSTVANVVREHSEDSRP